MIRQFTFWLMLGMAAQLSAAPLPQYDDYVHMGTPTCATSNCHGKTGIDKNENVQMNEYRMWSTDDFHSRAFQVLRNEESKVMAKALGLANAANADMCLDCHTDNVATTRRGEKFQMSDGVGCESCHGGAQTWLKTHTDPGATHASNLRDGLYPLSNPIARANLCLSCHMGTKDKLTTHSIMAAGHPRLSFELDTFTANQPAHYQVDDDYIERKGTHPVGYLWLVGQVGSAKQQLSLIDTHHLGKSMAAGMIEFAIYDCHSCHQGMTPLRGRPDDFSSALPSGGLRLSDHIFDMVAAIVAVVAADQYDAYAQSVRNLHQSHNKPQEISGAISELENQLGKLADRLATSPPSPQGIAAIRKHLVQHSADGHYADYGSAEQAFLAMEALSFSLGDRAGLKAALDNIFTSLENETTFEPPAFAKASARLLRALR